MFKATDTGTPSLSVNSPSTSCWPRERLVLLSWFSVIWKKRIVELASEGSGHAHRLIRKVPKTHRYVVTESARRTITALLAARNASADELTRCAG